MQHASGADGLSAICEQRDVLRGVRIRVDGECRDPRQENLESRLTLAAHPTRTRSFVMMKCPCGARPARNREGMTTISATPLRAPRSHVSERADPSRTNRIC